MRIEKKKEYRDSFWSGRKGAGPLYLFVFIWPFLYLFNHVFPINGMYTAIGNDFIALYYKYKIYLLDHLANFSFSLWSPAESAGFPFYVNPFAQPFYPLNLPLAVWYKISGGYNPLDHQVFTVLGISIFALGLFIWLKNINTNFRAVVFATLVMSVSFKITEIIRFPNAVHTAAWYPWILYAITKIMLSQSFRDTIKNGLRLVLFSICFCTAGYFYYVYYSLFLFVPYAIIFLIKPLRERLIGKEQICWKRAVVTLLLAGFVIILICGPYLLGVRQLMAQTTDRAGRDFAYSTAHIFNLEDIAGSFVYPPASAADGCCFFSITALLLIVLYVFSSAEKSNQLPASGGLGVKLFFIVWVGLISYISMGKESYLFVLLWKFMPGFSSLRVWARFNIILVPIIAWLLAIAYSAFESFLSDSAKNRERKYALLFKPVVVIAAIYTVIVATQLYLYINKIYDSMWLKYFKNVWANDIKFIIYGSIAFIVVGAIIFLHGRLSSQRFLTGTLVVLVTMATVEMRPVGAYRWTHEGKAIPYRINLKVSKINKAAFRLPRTDYSNTISLGPNFSVGIIDNWYFDRYVKFLKRTEGELEARRVLLGVKDGTKVFFSSSLEHPTVTAFLHDAVRYRENAPKVLSYNGDELLLEINAPADGYLSFIDNWDYGWKAFVDEKEEKIELLFGTFKSVKLSPGMHRVRFSYQPGWFFRFK